MTIEGSASTDSSLHARLRLILFNQIADALRVFLAVAVAGNGIGAAGRLDDDLRPENTGASSPRDFAL